MRKAAVAALLVAGCASAGEAPGPHAGGSEGPAPVPAPLAAPASPERASLEIPNDLWEESLRALGRPGRPLGYTAEEMAPYSGRKHLLRTVENLFRDARTLPRFSGALAEGLVKNAAKPEEVVRIAYGLTDAVAGRMLPGIGPENGWGEEGIGKDATAVEVLGALGADSWSTPVPGSDRRNLVTGLRPADAAVFGTLPPSVQRLLVRLVLAAAEGRSWAGKAFEGIPVPADEARLSLATAALSDERSGQMATTRKDAFDALAGLDREYLAFGSVVLLSRVSAALEEYAAAEKGAVPADFPGLRISTRAGTLLVLGAGDDDVPSDADLVVDLGGNDRWSGRHGSPKGKACVSLAVDLSGDDAWDDGGVPGSLACGLFGIGAVFDMGGNDRYACSESGLGAGWFGTGLLFDAAGDDVYETATSRGQGFGFAGVGALVDLAGNDRYVIGHDGQAYGGTLGCGLLLDVSGNDTYLARDDGNISEMYLGRSVSMAQGVGQGRRADLGDGHSLAGGFGVLVDGAGDDSYRAECWAHGAGYWWGCGILEDLGGNDVYRDGKYSLGAAAHFAVGICVDASGDDAYNVGEEEAVNQYQGHGRDGSLGVFVDGAGDDRYQLRAHCGGSGDLGSVGLFWDRCGDDVYGITAVRQGEGTGWPDTPPLGSATLSETMRSWRDDLDACGVFLDTGGRDDYRGEPGPWGDGLHWRTERGPRSKGWGRDLERFTPPEGR